MTKERNITAPTKEGNIETHTYREWSDINRVTVESIQKRQSVQNYQRAEGLRKYSAAEIVGTVRLNNNHNRYAMKKYDSNNLVAEFLSKSLTKQVQL